MPATERINMAKVYINEKNKKGHINPELYGNFSEHLGRCIYEGLYVGENSEIPNTNGMRNDVVAALKEMKLPVRWILYYGLIFAVLLLGAYGTGYQQVDLIYAGF